MPVALKNKIDLISPEFFGMLNDYMEYLVFKSQEQEKNPFPNRRPGIAKDENFWLASDFNEQTILSSPSKKRNAFGILKGHKFYMSEDFKKPLDDFEEYY